MMVSPHASIHWPLRLIFGSAAFVLLFVTGMMIVAQNSTQGTEPHITSALTCVPQSQTVYVGLAAVLSAVGGSEPYIWKDPEGHTVGEGTPAVKNFSQTGEYSVAVVDGANAISSMCDIHVVSH